MRRAHWVIDKVTRDLGERLATHTSIFAVMELVNEAWRARRARETADPSPVRFAVATAASLVFPFAPHLGTVRAEASAQRCVRALAVGER